MADHKPFTRQEIEELKTLWDAGQDAIDTEIGKRLIEEVCRLLIARDCLTGMAKDEDALVQANPGAFGASAYRRLKDTAGAIVSILNSP